MRTILEILSGGGYVSGEAISRELGVSRAAVWKKINALKEQGWQIESGGKRGYRLLTGDSLDPELWAGALKTRYMGRGERRYMPSVGSTNTEIKQMSLAGAPGGSICLCETQTAGRGRLGRTWVSPAGVGLWQSVLLRPALKPQDAPLITLCAAMAMARAVRETSGIDVRIKWPNDLVCGGKKLCGILLELAAEADAIEAIIVGIGLNVYKGAVPPELVGQAASIEDFTQPPLRREILTHYLAALEDVVTRLEQEGFDGIRAEYRAASCTLGHSVRVIGATEFIGEALDIDETGALLVRTEDGEVRRVLSGDVSVRGLMGYV